MSQKKTEMERIKQKNKGDYRLFKKIQTRWEDMDIYGHINNVVYLSWFDTVINKWYLEKGMLEIGGEQVFIVAATQANYFQDVRLTQKVECGVQVVRIGKSSVTYDIGVFADDNELTNARGFYTHVLVDNQTRKPTEIDKKRRVILESIK